MDNKIKHLELIQGVINRMASNSFALKGWTITLVAGIFVLANDANWLPFSAVFIPIIAFWLLDSYYLLKERLFKSLYDKVRGMNEADIDFSMNATRSEFDSSKNCFCSCFFSKTELPFYLSLALVCVAKLIFLC